jgi:RNA polymerase sigma factor (TIGR02999 family)
MSEFTQLLDAAAVGDANAPAKLFPIVYDELRRLAARWMAREQPGQTLDATALVHEAYIHLAGSPEPEAGWAGRSHFFRAAAAAMRHILIDNARRKRAAKRGGRHRFELSEADRVVLPDPDVVLVIDEALAKLAAEDPASAEVAHLRLFAGLSIDEAAGALGVSRATAYRDWAYARAVLTAALAPDANLPIS